MMHLLRKYDVARFTRNDAMFAQCAVRHTSLGEAVIIGGANIICRWQTSLKKDQLARVGLFSVKRLRKRYFCRSLIRFRTPTELMFEK